MINIFYNVGDPEIVTNDQQMELRYVCLSYVCAFGFDFHIQKLENFSHMLKHK